MSLALAVVLALTSALLFAISNVVEQRVAAEAPEDQSLRPELLVGLVHGVRSRLVLVEQEVELLVQSGA